ncbi:MAG: hypothetical protein WCF33_16415 [Pseudonocardiaceae bacterium]
MHEEDFNEALRQSLQAYRRFLADEDRPFEESRAFPMRTRVTAPSVTSPPASVESPGRSPSEGPPPVRPPSDNDSGAERPPRRRMAVKAVAVLGIAAAIALLAVAVFGLGGECPVIKVVAKADPAHGDVDCSQPVQITVHVRITTNDEATVSWAAGLGRKKLTRQTDLTFDKAGTQDVDLPVVDLKPNRDGEIKGSYVVVTNKPNKQEGHASYALRCVSGSR